MVIHPILGIILYKVWSLSYININEIIIIGI